MTAAHHRRALEIVPDPDDTATSGPTADSDGWRAQTVIDQYSPEHQFVGSLMWLTAITAQPLLELVPDTAIWRPQTRWAYELIRRVIDSGNDPTPPTVVAAGRRHAATDAINPNAAPTAHRQRQLALYLFDAYQHPSRRPRPPHRIRTRPKPRPLPGRPTTLLMCLSFF